MAVAGSVFAEEVGMEWYKGGSLRLPWALPLFKRAESATMVRNKRNEFICWCPLNIILSGGGIIHVRSETQILLIFSHSEQKKKR